MSATSTCWLHRVAERGQAEAMTQGILGGIAYAPLRKRPGFNLTIVNTGNSAAAHIIRVRTDSIWQNEAISADGRRLPYVSHIASERIGTTLVNGNWFLRLPERGHRHMTGSANAAASNFLVTHADNRWPWTISAGTSSA